MALWLVRHGQTHLNAEGRIRGWIDVPLDEKGEDEAHKMGEILEKYFPVPPLKIYTSDLIRSVKTAEIIRDELGIGYMVRTYYLRPWNLGFLQGKTLGEASKVISEYVLEKPDIPIPGGGESFDAFKERFVGYFLWLLKRSYKEGDQIAVAHYRNLKLAEGYLSGKNGKIDTSVFLKHDQDKTGELLRIEGSDYQLVTS